MEYIRSSILVDPTSTLVGDGRRTKFWQDSRLGDIPLALQPPTFMQYSENKAALQRGFFKPQRIDHRIFWQKGEPS